MEYITDDILKQIVLYCGEKEGVVEVISKESEAAVGHGENYCSDIDRVTVQLKLSSGKVISRTVVLKLFLQNLDSSALHELQKFWANEVTSYDKILVQFESLAEKHNLKNPRLWPKCFFANDKVLIMDDLKPKGYVVAPRQQGMKLEDAFSVMRYVGKLHALSMVAEKRKMIDPSIIRSPYTWVQLKDSWTYEFLRKVCLVSGDLIMQWGDEYKNAGKRIKDRAESISQTLNDLFFEEVKLKVVNHGDAWTNNILLKYDDNQHIESIRFVDFQNATYNSYAWDIVYYLYSSLVGEIMRSNYQQLIRTYHEEFQNVLRNLGEDPNSAPSLDDINREMDRLEPWALIVTLSVLAAAFNTSTHAVQLNELVTDDFKLRSLYTSDAWKSTMKIHMKYFIKNGLI